MQFINIALFTSLLGFVAATPVGVRSDLKTDIYLKICYSPNPPKSCKRDLDERGELKTDIYPRVCYSPNPPKSCKRDVEAPLDERGELKTDIYPRVCYSPNPPKACG
ncbi:hypothetical protein HII31_07038 [Pseudocercospora fuligena]|uniref:Uncharacterized protein n=1 Tax=Pseudocercospora fuligena TaxID=685502 RepID=A0A8H6RFG9_9PEZI|nr:hypothetical protein HII31_07038 [Pseudocercospora fuligena]